MESANRNTSHYQTCDDMELVLIWCGQLCGQSLESTLQDVGEECEQLLVEAGRKYRLALSMDRTDMRALYNWGLALCYRGQLIAEEGGEVYHPFIASMNSNSSSPLAVGSTLCAGVTLNCRRFYLRMRYSRRGCFSEGLDFWVIE